MRKFLFVLIVVTVLAVTTATARALDLNDNTISFLRKGCGTAFAEDPSVSEQTMRKALAGAGIEIWNTNNYCVEKAAELANNVLLYFDKYEKNPNMKSAATREGQCVLRHLTHLANIGYITGFLIQRQTHGAIMFGNAYKYMSIFNGTGYIFESFGACVDVKDWPVK